MRWEGMQEMHYSLGVGVALNLRTVHVRFLMQIPPVMVIRNQQEAV